MSDSKPLIYGKIADCIRDIEAVGKSHRNQQQGYNFRSIDDFYDAMQPVLAKHRVFVAPTILEHSREERQTKSGGTLMTTITKVRYKLFAEDGSFIEADALGEGADSGDKSANKAAATAIKYLFMQVFAVRVNGENHDSERDHHEYAPKPNRNPKTTVTEVTPKPDTAAAVLPAKADESIRARAFDLLATEFGADLVKQYLDITDIAQWELESVPTGKRALGELSNRIAAWIAERNDAIKPDKSGDELPPEIANVVFHIPPKGMKKSEYKALTIGQMWADRHNQETAARLFGTMNNFEAKGWTKRNADSTETQMPPSAEDIALRKGLDLLAEFVRQREEEGQQ